MVLLSSFVREILKASEKASNIARTIRSEHSLFELLVQEKCGDHKNAAASQDFKTLGDVLIQETVKHDLNNEFKGLGERILGEESNKFTNTLGETITIEIQETWQKTSSLLKKVLDDNVEASDILAKAVHFDAVYTSIPAIDELKEDIDLTQVGFWIDPIDSTSQYIKGLETSLPKNGVYPRGLQCVTVLIGAYSVNTGVPFFGSVNQPFAVRDSKTKTWSGHCSWGLNYKGISLHNIEQSKENDTESKIIVNWRDPEEFKSNFNWITSCGAGYKFLVVAQQHVNGYISTTSGTYRWDTCASKAILNCIGGDILDYSKVLEVMKGKTVQDIFNNEKSLPDELLPCSLTYHKPNEGVDSVIQQWCHTGGLLAYSNTDQLQNILQAIAK